MILHRLFHEETVRLFDEQGVAFNCSCSRDRAANALVSMGRPEVETLLDEQQGKIRVDCQFCNEQQVFDAADIAQIFAGGGTQTPGNTRH